VEDLVQGDQAVERVEPRVDLGGVGVFFDLEEDHVFDGLGLGVGGHLDRVEIWMGRCLAGEKVRENGREKSECTGFRTQHRV
jgi:hypothetical protein